MRAARILVVGAADILGRGLAAMQRRKKLIGSSYKFCRSCIFGQGSPPLNFGSQLDPDSKSRLKIWAGFALAEVCALRVLLFII